MKKILSILLILIYSTATFGMSVKEFYCCGKIKSVSISFNKIAKAEKEKDGCCKTKYHLSKVKDNHVTTDAITPTAKYFTYSAIGFSVFNIDTFTNPVVNVSNGIHGPPLLLQGNTPVYIFIRSLRI